MQGMKYAGNDSSMLLLSSYLKALIRSLENDVTQGHVGCFVQGTKNAGNDSSMFFLVAIGPGNRVLFISLDNLLLLFHYHILWKA